MKKYMFAVLIMCLVIGLIGTIFFRIQFKKFSKNELVIDENIPVEYAEFNKYFFKDTCGNKQVFKNKFRNPVVFFKDLDSNSVMLHKLDLSLDSTVVFDSIILVNYTKPVISNWDLYSFLINNVSIPFQGRLNSKKINKSKRSIECSE